MKKKLSLLMIAATLAASPANATPQRVPLHLFSTMDACMAAVAEFWRGNHAFYCEWKPEGYYLVYDQGYEASKKGPKN